MKKKKEVLFSIIKLIFVSGQIEQHQENNKKTAKLSLSLSPSGFQRNLQIKKGNKIKKKRRTGKRKINVHLEGEDDLLFTYTLPLRAQEKRKKEKRKKEEFLKRKEPRIGALFCFRIFFHHSSLKAPTPFSAVLL